MGIIKLANTPQQAGYPFQTREIWTHIGTSQITPHRGNKIYHFAPKLLHLVTKTLNKQ